MLTAVVTKLLSDPREPRTLNVQVARPPRGVGLAGAAATGVTVIGTALSGGLVMDCVSSGVALIPAQIALNSMSRVRRPFCLTVCPVKRMQPHWSGRLDRLQEAQHFETIMCMTAKLSPPTCLHGAQGSAADRGRNALRRQFRSCSCAGCWRGTGAGCGCGSEAACTGALCMCEAWRMGKHQGERQ